MIWKVASIPQNELDDGENVAWPQLIISGDRVFLRISVEARMFVGQMAGDRWWPC